MNKRLRAGSIVAIADIDSDSVGMALEHMGGDASPSLVYAERFYLPHERRSPGHTDSAVIALLADACTKAAEALARMERGDSVECCYAILGTPWVHSATVRVETKFEYPKKISEGIIVSLSQMALDKQTELDKAKIFEASIESVELNGYPTESPEGKTADHVRVSALLSQCEPDMKANVTELMRRHFPASSVLLRSDVRALFAATREVGLGLRSRTILSVGSDTSTCMVVRKGAIGEHIVIPMGTAAIVRQISGKGLPEETLSILRMAARGTCSTPACDALTVSLAVAEPGMVKTYGQSLAIIASRYRLPNDAILIVRPEFAPWMEQFFSRIDFAQFTKTTQPFVPQKLPDLLNRFLVPEKGVVIDAGLAVAARSVNIEALQQ